MQMSPILPFSFPFFSFLSFTILPQNLPQHPLLYSSSSSNGKKVGKAPGIITGSFTFVTAATGPPATTPTCVATPVGTARTASTALNNGLPTADDTAPFTPSTDGTSSSGGDTKTGEGSSTTGGNGKTGTSPTITPLAPPELEPPLADGAPTDALFTAEGVAFAPTAMGVPRAEITAGRTPGSFVDTSVATSVGIRAATLDVTSVEISVGMASGRAATGEGAIAEGATAEGEGAGGGRGGLSVGRGRLKSGDGKMGGKMPGRGRIAGVGRGKSPGSPGSPDKPPLAPAGTGGRPRPEGSVGGRMPGGMTPGGRMPVSGRAIGGVGTAGNPGATGETEVSTAAAPEKGAGVGGKAHGGMDDHALGHQVCAQGGSHGL